MESRSIMAKIKHTKYTNTKYPLKIIINITLCSFYTNMVLLFVKSNFKINSFPHIWTHLI